MHKLNRWKSGKGYFFEIGPDKFYGFGQCNLVENEKIRVLCSPGTGEWPDKLKVEEILPPDAERGDFKPATPTKTPLEPGETDPKYREYQTNLFAECYEDAKAFKGDTVLIAIATFGPRCKPYHFWLQEREAGVKKV